MKNINSKKGLTALMATLMGVSMFTTAGSGITNAGIFENISNIGKSFKSSNNDKDKKPKKAQTTFEDFGYVKGKADQKNVLKIKKVQLSTKFEKLISKNINVLINEANSKKNSSEELVNSLGQVIENCNEAVEKIKNADNLDSVNTINKTYSDKIEKRLNEIVSFMNGSKANEFKNELDKAQRRLNDLKQVFNKANGCEIENGEISDIENVLNKISSILDNNCFSESNLNEIQNILSGVISKRIVRLEGKKDGNAYFPVKERIDNLNKRLDSINISGNELVNEKASIKVELQRLNAKLEENKYSSADIKLVNDLVTDCENNLKELENKVNSMNSSIISNIFGWFNR